LQTNCEEGGQTTEEGKEGEEEELLEEGGGNEGGGGGAAPRSLPIAAPYEADGFDRLELTALSQVQVSA